MKAKKHFLTLALLLTALLNCFSQPVIIADPQSRTNVLGTDAIFTALATGTDPLAYQWRFSSTDLVGKTNDTLIVTNVQAASAGDYTVVVTNMEGAVTSLVATLTVLIPPKITKQPTNQTASLFADATFRVTAIGDAPLSYQWRFNDDDLIGRTNTSLTVTNVQRINAGTHYSVVVTNYVGSVTSQMASLTITPFNSIYCFGYSWTDTQAASHGCGGPTRCPSCYWQGRYSNGPMWPESLSTNLGLAYVAANNYAHCGAGAVEVRGQVNSFPAPPKPQLSLYFLMFSDDILRALPPDGFGAGYLDVTNTFVWNQVIQTGVVNHSNAVQRLYAKGARTIVIQSEIDFGKAPEVLSQFGNDAFRLSKVSEYCARYNLGFFDAVTAYAKTQPDLRIVWVDLFSKVNDVASNPAQYGFTISTVDALDDPLLTNKTFSGPGADYVFWDSLHPTSKLHALMSAWNLEALTNSILETLDVTITGGSPSIQMNHLLIGRDYTLQSSPDLSHWQDIQTFTAAAVTNQWTGAPDAVNAAFYRLKWQP